MGSHRDAKGTKAHTLLTLVASLALTCALVPTALAATGGSESVGEGASAGGALAPQGTAVTITIGSDGKPTASSGPGWQYTNTLALSAGYDFTITGGTCTCAVLNYATIVDGSFDSATITNFGTIKAGTFGGNVANAALGAKIESGTYEGTVACLDAEIDSGTFNGRVILGEKSAIYGGIFNSSVSVNTMGNNGGAIYDGTFNGSVDVWANVHGGKFNGPVTVETTGIINNGTFNASGTIANNGVINGGTYWGVITNNGTIAGSVLQGVTHTLVNITSDGAITVTPTNTYTETLTAASGYTLPASITVTLNGHAAVSGTDYTWDPSTGKLVIYPTQQGNLATNAVGPQATTTDPNVGPITITATATKLEPTPATPTAPSDASPNASQLAPTGDALPSWAIADATMFAAAGVALAVIARRRAAL